MPCHRTILSAVCRDFSLSNLAVDVDVSHDVTTIPVGQGSLDQAKRIRGEVLEVVPFVPILRVEVRPESYLIPEKMKLRMKSRCFGHGMRAGPVSSVFQLSFLLLPALVILAVAGEEAIEGTLLFLHVWKCGGTSLRKLLCDWAREEGLPCATVATCSKLSLDVSDTKTWLLEHLHVPCP